MRANHLDFYSKARFYDLAFSFKNVAEENRTLLDLYRRVCGREARSFLDIGAGPATNAIEMAGRGLRAGALDFSAEMVEYGRAKAADAGVALDYRQGDMRDFAWPEPVDLAAIFMDSTSYLLTNEDVASHLRAVAGALTEGGLYALEMSHPRDVFAVGKSASTEWTQREGELSVSVRWGAEGDPFDPIRQTTLVTATLTYDSPTERGEVTDRSEQRCFTYQEFDALVRASGAFDLVEVLGSLKPDVRFSNAPESWRMIPILRKR